MKHKIDFAGMATKANLRCADGLTIGVGAFDDNCGKIVPLCWQHQHDDPANVLGQALLTKKNGGVYCQCSFNNSPQAQAAKEAVQHGDINALSIFANQLTKNGSTVTHGTIREVSLVYAGANPGALIDYVAIRHSVEDDSIELIHAEEFTDQAIIHTNERIDYINEEDNNMENEELVMSKQQLNDTIEHAVENAISKREDETIKDIFDTLSEKQKKAVYAIIGMSLENKEIKHDAMDEEELDQLIDEAVDEAIEEVISESEENYEDDYEDDYEEDYEEDEDMKDNTFEHDYMENGVDFNAVESEVMDAFAHGLNFKQALQNITHDQDFLAHAAATGISNISNLFPEPKLVDGSPFIVKKDSDWVIDMMKDITKQPFGRIKSNAVDISQASARAKGYVKGATKVNSQMASLKRVTNPTMVYVKADLDKQDILEITDFNVVAILKQGLDVVLRNEVCQQILVSDQRASSSADKIDNTCIRPIFMDDSTYVIRRTVTIADTATDKVVVDTLRHAIYDARKDYKGSGSVKMYTTPSLISRMMLAQDVNGRDMFDSEAKLASSLRAKALVEVPDMEGATYTVTEGSTDKTYQVLAIFVNLADYTIGCVKGGETSSYEQFDIDKNQMKYLTETFISGALTRPYSAIVIQKEVTTPSAS